ncbi:MAG: 16S rRNA (guanine(527)-N(7))-methyltransferase RsmG [Denitrovibrio sp.]|nr:MAG: 16S rRNA (guanine(527)-N(7))-methyltransferase RsmG [Denitrovibrio sp.]
MIENYYKFTEKQLEQIALFYEMHEQATLNLTAIKDKKMFYVKHVLDSFLLYTERVKLLKGDVADIGTGGGFPGMVLAIMYPELKFTLVDSIAKKCKFLTECANALELGNVEVIVSRSEDLKGKKFSTILSRGVAKVEQMIKYTWHLSESDCVWVLYKGENVSEELETAQNIMKKRKLEFINVRYETPIQRTYTILAGSGGSSRLY